MLAQPLTIQPDLSGILQPFSSLSLHFLVSEIRLSFLRGQGEGKWDVITMMTFFLVSLFIEVLNFGHHNSLVSQSSYYHLHVSISRLAQKGEVNFPKPHGSGKAGIRKPLPVSFGL